MNELTTKQLLFDFFEGQTTVMQRKLIEQWLEDSDNEQTYYRYVDEWERSRPQVLIDADQAWQRYDRFLAGESLPEKRTREMFPQRRMPTVLWRPWIGLLAAASVILGLTCIFQNELIYKTFDSPTGQAISLILSDGTKVALNSNSSLRVPRFGFGKDVRRVWLKGEAEFKVIHQKNNLRFEVLMGDGYRIEVLGTEFNAFSRARGKRVFLAKGKVKLNLPKGKQVYLSPGNYFTADAKGRFRVIRPGEPLAITAWKEQTFYFDDTPLAEVVEQINERFAAHIRIADRQLASRKMGGIYQATDPDALLDILSAMFEMEITRNAEEIELRSPKN
jgi:transmembrane sensor